MPVKEIKTLAMAANVFSNPTWDVILVFALIAIGFFYGISRGRHKMISTVLNTYVSLAVAQAVPLGFLSDLIGTKDMFILQVAVYLVILLLLSLTLERGRKLLFVRHIAWWHVFLLSFLQTGLVIHILFSFLPPERAKLLAPLTKTVFANPSLHIWWLVGPLVILILVRRFGRDQ